MMEVSRGANLVGMSMLFLDIRSGQNFGAWKAPKTHAFEALTQSGPATWTDWVKGTEAAPRKKGAASVQSVLWHC
ncbi:hypothetical protein MTR_8g070710 [Medicago truncatula]|uniref:Uncharacterized protein n=1 Tax=Medicago truncatula TaxID=3880 RepID=G7L731_MEDTR|nr:hypothetical protein MTR_8g070710 [Medicago truncatula]